MWLLFALLGLPQNKTVHRNRGTGSVPEAQRTDTQAAIDETCLPDIYMAALHRFKKVEAAARKFCQGRPADACGLADDALAGELWPPQLGVSPNTTFAVSLRPA